MSVLTKYFDRVYCMNLKRRQDRWKDSVLEFKKHNLDDVNRFEAIDGKLYDWSTVNYNENLLSGELGFIETQINIISEAIKNNYSSIVIFEDDVYFTSEIANLEEYINSVPNDWDMIYFGGNHTYGDQPEQINDKVIKLHNTFSTEGIIIKNTLFDVLLEITKDREKSMDSYYADLQKKYNVYGFYPNITLQKMGYSDIQNKKVDYFNNYNRINNEKYATKNNFNK